MEADSVEYVFVVRWDHEDTLPDGRDSGMLGAFRMLESAMAASSTDYAAIDGTELLTWVSLVDEEDSWQGSPPSDKRWYSIERYRLQD